MDSLSLFVSYFEWLVLNNEPLEFTFFILLQATSPKKRTAWVYLLSCFKPPVLNNGPLKFTFLSCSKPLVLNNGPLEFTLSSCFRRSVPTNEQFQITFYFLESVIPSMSSREVSLKSFVSIKLSLQSFSPVKLHSPSEVGALSSNEFGYPVVFSHFSQVIFVVLHSLLHHEHFTASHACIHDILGSKIGVLCI